MARSTPPTRLRDLIDVAAEVFIANGYRRTQMETVADALGVAKGTLYAYVESKEALFDAAAVYADRLDDLPGPSALPLPTPKPRDTIEKIRLRLAEEAEGVEFIAAARRRPDDMAREFAAIVRDLYARLSRNRRSIKILDRCSLDQPELAAIWFGDGRRAHLAALAHYLDTRIAQGHLRALPDTLFAARIVLEAIVFWAVHRHWDPAPQSLREEDVPSLIVELLLHGLLKEPL